MTNKAFAAWFAFCALMSIAILGLSGWAIIKLVTHFTAS